MFYFPCVFIPKLFLTKLFEILGYQLSSTLNFIWAFSIKASLLLKYNQCFCEYWCFLWDPYVLIHVIMSYADVLFLYVLSFSLLVLSFIDHFWRSSRICRQWPMFLWYIRYNKCIVTTNINQTNAKFISIGYRMIFVSLIKLRQG